MIVLTVTKADPGDVQALPVMEPAGQQNYLFWKAKYRFPAVKTGEIM